jgi:NCS1 nucleoside transporter family
MTATVNDGPIELDVVREGDYGDKVAVVEPGGAEFIPLAERHGKPGQLFWTWTSPNFEFATVFVGVLAVAVFGLSFGQAVGAIVLGTVMGSVTMGALSARGPQYGVPQMVLSRISFGYWGNALPAGLNSVTAGIGWFAVNSVSGALALSSLIHLNKYASLVIITVLQIGIALYGHNLVHAFERIVFPLLFVAFALAMGWTFTKAHYGAAAPSTAFASGIGGFLLTLGATFGYAAGWNPYASDYTRYLAPDTSKRAVAWWSGLGVALSCIALEIVGAATVTIVGGNALSGPSAFVSPFPTAVADLVLLAIALGAVAANVLNVYSGSMSFVTLGIRLNLTLRRALAAGVFGVLGFVVALIGLNDIDKYENFLLVIAYWIGPWLAVVFTDQVLRRGSQARLLYNEKHTSWAGPIAMLVGMGVAIPLFSNQTQFVGFIARNHPALGDLGFEVGFVVSAMVYAVGFMLENRRTVTLPA